MSVYTNSRDWYEYDHGIFYRVTQPIEWLVGSVETGATYTIPVGAQFDVSVPRYARWLCNPHNPKYFKAAALHDHFLSIGWDRFTAGAQFHQALKADGVPKLRRALMALAVLFFKYQ